MKRNLNAANAQLFERSPDERFPSLQSLFRHCQKQKEVSVDRWHPPTVLNPEVSTGNLVVTLGDDGAFLLNDWSFSQLCKLSSVSKDTVNRLSGDTTRRVFEEMMPRGNVSWRSKPASDWRLKTSQIEEKSSFNDIFWTLGSREVGWRTGSRWRKFKRYCP